MIKNILIILGAMLLIILIGTIGFYKVAGTVSGQDAICISGIFAGLVVGLWQGKHKGITALNAVLFCSMILSLPLVLFTVFMAHDGKGLVESLAFFSVGFSLLFFYIVGCRKELKSLSS